jgi:formylglycine-generating enzyme required for sulfatase activity
MNAQNPTQLKGEFSAARNERGGHCFNKVGSVRVSRRSDYIGSAYRGHELGFRLVRNR